MHTYPYLLDLLFYINNVLETNILRHITALLFAQSVWVCVCVCVCVYKKDPVLHQYMAKCATHVLRVWFVYYMYCTCILHVHILYMYYLFIYTHVRYTLLLHVWNMYIIYVLHMYYRRINYICITPKNTTHVPHVYYTFTCGTFLV